MDSVYKSRDSRQFAEVQRAKVVSQCGHYQIAESAGFDVENRTKSLDGDAWVAEMKTGFYDRDGI